MFVLFIKGILILNVTLFDLMQAQLQLNKPRDPVKLQFSQLACKTS